MPRPPRKRVLAALLLLAHLPAPTAYADGPTDVTNPTIWVTLTEITGGTNVCGDGVAAVAGSWTMGANGLRSHPGEPQISATAASPPVTRFHNCWPVYHDSPAGFFYVVVTYGGGTGTAGTVRPGAAHGVVVWALDHPDVHMTSGDG